MNRLKTTRAGLAGKPQAHAARTLAPVRSNPEPSRRRAGFTLVELLLVVTIIALLASLLFPAVQTMIAKADSISCQSNLRQLGIAVQSAAQDNNNVYPYIEPASDPSLGNPVYDPDGTIKAKSLLDTLSPYGITPRSVQCRADLKTLTGDSAALYAKTPDKYSSYIWIPILDGERTMNPSIYTRWGGTFHPSPSKLRLITDANKPHGAKQNRLYADGHVVGF